MSASSSVKVVLGQMGPHWTFFLDVLPDVKLEMSAAFTNIERRVEWILEMVNKAAFKHLFHWWLK